jgi:protein TonB
MQKGVVLLLWAVAAASPVSAAPPAFPGYDQIPTSADMAKFYPDKALDVGKEGGAVLKCTVKKDRFLANCAVASETPEGFGFGDSALKLSKLFKMKSAAKPGSRITIPIQFTTPG